LKTPLLNYKLPAMSDTKVLAIKLIRYTVWQATTKEKYKQTINMLLGNDKEKTARLKKLRKVLVSEETMDGVERTEWIEIK